MGFWGVENALLGWFLAVFCTFWVRKRHFGGFGGVLGPLGIPIVFGSGGQKRGFFALFSRFFTVFGDPSGFLPIFTLFPIFAQITGF